MMPTGFRLSSLASQIAAICLISSTMSAQANPSGTAQDPAYVVEQNLEQQAQQLYDLLNHPIYQAIGEGTNAMQQVNTTVQRSLMGKKNLGAQNNSTAEQNFRNWTPTAEDLEQMTKQGLQTGSLADQIRYYNQKFPIPTQHTEHATAANDYNSFAQSNTNAAFSVADKSFDNAKLIAQQINQLYQEIDQQDNLKSSTDLNSAILLKIVALQADLMRIQAQQLKLQAVNQQQNNSQRNYLQNFVQDVPEE